MPVALMIIGLILLEGDFGTALILVPMVAAMLWVNGAPFRLFFGGAVVLLTAVALLSITQPYRMRRFSSWLDPASDPLDGGWQLLRGQSAMSGGGWFGVGLGASREKWDWLPAAHTDFIYAVVGEELGILGSLLVLGLFTAIRRLRAVHGRIADRLAREGLPLYAQHVDPIDTGTLVDIFRDDPRASLLGTDALRDGVDVPGHSLRLVVMEQVPWPRPSILHRARRASGGGTAYDDEIIRARLAQAFGRLIRTREDRGHFVVLSAAFPSRLLDAFPPGTPVDRVTLDEALQFVRQPFSALVVRF